MTPRTLQIIESSRPAGWVLEPLAKELLREQGLPVPAGRWVRTPQEAEEAALALGFPLAAKVVSPAVLHKSDVGGVALHVADSGRLKSVLEAFLAMEKSEGMYVERMGSGVEVIVGSRFDRQFGPIVLVGLGGTSVEIYKDVAIRMAPLDAAQAREAILGLKGARLLTGYRGKPAADLEALAGFVAAFSEVAMTLGDRIESVDLNPVLCSPTGVTLADARIML